MKDIRRKFDLMVDLLKFTSNKNLLSKVVTYATTDFIVKFCQKKNIYIYIYIWVRDTKYMGKFNFELNFTLFFLSFKLCVRK